MNTTITPSFTTQSNPIIPPKISYTFYVVRFHGPTDTKNLRNQLAQGTLSG